MPLKAVLLDIDGTLVDSNDAHARAWVDALAEAGHRVPFERVRRLIGMGGDKLLPEVVGISEDSEEGGRLSTRRSAIFKERYLPTVRPFPGSRALLERFRRDGLTLAVASSAKADELDPLLRIAGADGLVSARTSSDDAEESKPDPDIVHAALARVGQPPDAVLMLGDTPYDVEAATRAGVGIVVLRCGGWDDRALAGALAIYDDPAELMARYEESPFAEF